MSITLARWNGDRLVKQLSRQVLQEYGPVIYFQTREEIATEQFSWPNRTRRKNRTVAGTTRDIIDTGAFINSATDPEVTQRGGILRLTITWTAPYSGEILRGSEGEQFVDYAGTVGSPGQPARDWITPALAKQPFDRFFVERYKALAPGR